MTIVFGQAMLLRFAAAAVLWRWRCGA